MRSSTDHIVICMDTIKHTANLALELALEVQLFCKDTEFHNQQVAELTELVASFPS